MKILLKFVESFLKVFNNYSCHLLLSYSLEEYIGYLPAIGRTVGDMNTLINWY